MSLQLSGIFKFVLRVRVHILVILITSDPNIYLRLRHSHASSFKKFIYDIRNTRLWNWTDILRSCLFQKAGCKSGITFIFSRTYLHVYQILSWGCRLPSHFKFAIVCVLAILVADFFKMYNLWVVQFCKFWADILEVVAGKTGHRHPQMKWSQAGSSDVMAGLG